MLSSGVVMPEMGWTPLVGFFGVPSMEEKNAVAYWPPTLAEKARSKAYLTSLEVISRLTGGANFTPLRIFTVICLLSAVISGAASARSGTCSAWPGLKP